MTDLKVDREESLERSQSIPRAGNRNRLSGRYLGILVNLSVGVVRDNGRVEEIEETVGLHLLGDGSNAAFGLMFLFLLDLFHCEVFPFLPLHCAASAFDDFWSLQYKPFQMIISRGRGVHCI